MAALASLGTLVGAGAHIAGNVRAAQTANAVNRANLQIAQQQDAARQQEIRAQQVADADARRLQLAQSVAGSTARAASDGLLPNDGSAAAITAGEQQVAATAQQDANAIADARLAAIGPSLLMPDGTVTALLQSGRSFGVASNNLLG